jgi:hypothetical protein
MGIPIKGAIKSESSWHIVTWRLFTIYDSRGVTQTQQGTSKTTGDERTY